VDQLGSEVERLSALLQEKQTELHSVVQQTAALLEWWKTVLWKFMLNTARLQVKWAGPVPLILCSTQQMCGLSAGFSGVSSVLSQSLHYEADTQVCIYRV
jgi:hypothetical protein